VTSIDGLNFYDCKDVRLGDTTGLVYAAVDGFDNYGQPLSKGSLELLSKTNIGVGFRSILDGNGNATIEVPVDNYNAVVRSPGFVPGTQDILVSTQGATLNTSLSAPPPCTYTYSAWSACENDTQTRTVMSSYPDVCFGMPLLSQYCTDQNEMCCACYFDVYCDDFGPGGCWFCRTSTYNSEGECQAPYGYLTSPGPCFCRPELYQICLGSSG
jgi:hypothetical protein